MSKKEAQVAANQPQQGNLNAILDRGTTYEGKLTFEGTVMINGKFDGEIFSKDHLIIGEHGRVNGEINVGTLQLSGDVSGKIRATQKVEILATGKFRGEMELPPQALRIEPGALFDGTCKMAGGAGSKPAQEPVKAEKNQ